MIRKILCWLGWPAIKLHDLADMPGLQDWIGTKKTFNAAGKQTGARDITFVARGVSSGRVYWDGKNKVSCREHRAMNCVNPEGTIWRCEGLGCGAAAYLERL